MGEDEQIRRDGSRSAILHNGAIAGLRIFPGGQFDPGKIALLEAIRKTGSIPAAAQSIQMSYRKGSEGIAGNLATLDNHLKPGSDQRLAGVGIAPIC
jgi:hypothetical protein